jgi:hypothetical protein
VTPQAFLEKLDGVIFLDGTISTLRIEDLVNPSYARAKNVVGWTVADLFRKGFPDREGGGNTYINAWTPPTGPYIFLYGQGVLGSPLPPFSGVNAATIAHEVFHKLGQYDEDLKRAKFGINQQDPSGKFTEYFRSKCL